MLQPSVVGRLQLDATTHRWRLNHKNRRFTLLGQGFAACPFFGQAVW